MVVRLINSYRVLAALLGLPWALLAVGYASGRLFYGELIHASGEWSIWTLMLALAVTPLRRMFPRQRWTAWLVPRRRYFGVASFAYALLHAAVYLARQGDWPKILEQAIEAGILTGWLAFVLFVPMNLNRATGEEFLTIPGMTPRMVHEFEEYRPYTSFEQFRREIGKYVDAREVARLERYVVIN